MRTAALLLAVAAGASTLSACAYSQTCFSWVDFENAAAAGEDSTLVVVGTPTRSGGTDFYGQSANRYQVDITRVVKGAYDSDTIEVVSTPGTCQEEAYPDGDPLNVNAEVELFLHKDDAGYWRLITPYDGVEHIAAGGSLPWEPTP